MCIRDRGKSIDGGNQRFGESANGGPMILARINRAFTAGLVFDFTDIGPGGKIALGPAQECHADRGISGNPLQCPGQGRQGCRVQRILGLGAVQGQAHPGACLLYTSRCV